MKFSELSTDKALDVMCELTPHIDSIVNDQTVIETIGKVVKLDGDINRYGNFMIVMGRLTEFIPMLLKTHRPDVYGILSVLNEKSADDVSKQPVMDTMRQLREVFQDKELIDFFRSFMPQVQKEQSAPSVDSPASE